MKIFLICIVHDEKTFDIHWTPRAFPFRFPLPRHYAAEKGNLLQFATLLPSQLGITRRSIKGATFLIKPTRNIFSSSQLEPGLLLTVSVSGWLIDFGCSTYFYALSLVGARFL
jgi:hypothetical protein